MHQSTLLKVELDCEGWTDEESCLKLRRGGENESLENESLVHREKAMLHGF